jgi:carboxypeptidase family protein/Big-like domain-containing protein
MAGLSRAIVGLAITLSVAGCSTDRSPASPTAPGTTVSRVIVAGTPPAIGMSSQFTALAVLPDGSNQTVTSQAVWRSSNPSVATVTSAGMVSVASSGSVEISATYANTTGALMFTTAPPVGYTLRGTVVDAQTGGGGVAAATVTVKDASGGTQSGMTDTSGQYSIGGLAAGPAEVTATAPSYVRVARMITISGDMTLSITLQRGAACPLIGFDDLSSHAAAFTSYSVCGFTVTGMTTNWTVSTNYGRPAPFIQFLAPGGTTAVGEVLVTASGATFRFSSVDLYSSTTPIPYVITGIASPATVFTIQNTQPNTFGNFATIVNPDAARQVDALVIRLSNPAAPCCSNPMGLDNIVLAR